MLEEEIDLRPAIERMGFLMDQCSMDMQRVVDSEYPDPEDIIYLVIELQDELDAILTDYKKDWEEIQRIKHKGVPIL